jgi:transposase InsO family protein
VGNDIGQDYEIIFVLQKDGMALSRGFEPCFRRDTDFPSWQGGILLKNYYLPGDLEASIGLFVDHYNHRRYHESLDNLTPADVYFGRAQTILLERDRIK